MTHDEKLAAIRDACVKARPNLRFRSPGGRWLYRDITLEHVMATAIAINLANRTRLTIESSGQFLNGVTHHLGPYWTLCSSLDEQSEDCIAFLYDLLCAA